MAWLCGWRFLQFHGKDRHTMTHLLPITVFDAVCFKNYTKEAKAKFHRRSDAPFFLLLLVFLVSFLGIFPLIVAIHIVAHGLSFHVLAKNRLQEVPRFFRFSNRFFFSTLNLATSGPCFPGAMGCEGQPGASPRESPENPMSAATRGEVKGVLDQLWHQVQILVKISLLRMRWCMLVCSDDDWTILFLSLRHFVESLADRLIKSISDGCFRCVWVFMAGMDPWYFKPCTTSFPVVWQRPTTPPDPRKSLQHRWGGGGMNLAVEEEEVGPMREVWLK